MNEEQKDRGTANEYNRELKPFLEENECTHELEPFREEDWVLEQFIRYREAVDNPELAFKLVDLAAQLRRGFGRHF